MSHKEIAAALLLALSGVEGLAGCAVPKPPSVRPSEPPGRWWVAERGSIVVLEPERRPFARFEARYVGPVNPSVGEVVSIEVWVPGAARHERHRFRIRPVLPGVRAVGAEVIETEGDRPATARFTADGPGSAGVTIEPIR